MMSRGTVVGPTQHGKTNGNGRLAVRLALAFLAFPFSMGIPHAVGHSHVGRGWTRVHFSARGWIRSDPIEILSDMSVATEALTDLKHELVTPLGPEVLGELLVSPGLGPGTGL